MNLKVSSFIVASAIACLGSLPARASIILSITPVSVQAGANSAIFDVDIENTGPTAQNIAGFTFALTVANANISFTGGDFSTTLPYLFTADSFDQLNGFTLTDLPPAAQTLQASDLSNGGSGTNIAAGAAYGLGEIFFNVSPAILPGPVTVTLTPDCNNPNLCTSLSDSSGSNVPFSATNGTITVTSASAVPEPSTFALLFLALPAAAYIRTRRS
jgi:hypothetical protein